METLNSSYYTKSMKMRLKKLSSDARFISLVLTDVIIATAEGVYLAQSLLNTLRKIRKCEL